MSKRWIHILVLLVLALGVLPILPAAAQSSCTISTRGTVRMRAGHSINDAVVGTMPRNKQLQAVERFVEDLGRNRTRVWYRLVKEEAAPTATAEQVWVGGTVRTTGDCVNIASVAPAAPVAPSGDAGASAPAPSGAVLPQSGNWTLTYGGTVNVSCDGIGSADFATGEEFGQTVFTTVIASNGSNFTLDGDNFTQDANGTWHGYYEAPEIQATGEAYIRVDTPTSILGDIIVRVADIPGCSFKFPFWASPQ